MAGRVTIQNIADALGVSRNTVSKALNNTGVLAESTRERILKKAVEMGYKQLSYFSTDELPSFIRQADSEPDVPKGKKGGSVALLTTVFVGGSHFASTMLDKIQRELSLLNYSLTIHLVTAENILQQTLPVSFQPDSADGIICVEIFDSAYSRMLCELSLPVLFVDAPADLLAPPLKADLLLMNNRANIYRIVSALSEKGVKKFGFIGETGHCLSFFERFSALREACCFLNLDCGDRYQVIENKMDRVHFSNFKNYQDYIVSRLRALKELPDVFFCANDFVAADAIRAFRELGVRVPEDVLFVGFDDSPESGMIAPSLTTIHIHSQIMGASAVQLLISRIREPQMHYRTVYTETSIVWRESTGI